ncbi:MAG: hypothetical protein AAGG75_03845 [Bacteroidota bacterium]
MKPSKSKNLRTLKQITVQLPTTQLKQLKGGSGGIGVIDIVEG